MIPTRKRFDGYGCGYQSCRETSDLDPVVVPDWVVGICILEVGSEIGEQGLSPVMQLPAVSGHSCLGARAQAWGSTSRNSGCVCPEAQRTRVLPRQGLGETTIQALKRVGHEGGGIHEIWIRNKRGKKRSAKKVKIQKRGRKGGVS